MLEQYHKIHLKKAYRKLYENYYFIVKKILL